MISMRLMRFGAKSRPSYRIVVMDSEKPRESKAKDYIGSYNPLKEPPEIHIDLDKAKFWIERGAKASQTVRSLIRKASQPSKLSNLQNSKS
jgi:small subunit ribosomal protein S16